MPRRFTRKEKQEKQHLALLLLAQNPHTGKRLCVKIGLAPSQAAWFRSWRGKNKPLKVNLTIPQIEKLGLPVVGVEDYSENVGKRIPVFFHPSKKKLVKLLKQYENKKVYMTPTSEGLEVEQKIGSLTRNSQSAVEMEIQRLKGQIILTFPCPYCGRKIVLKGYKGEEVEE